MRRSLRDIALLEAYLAQNLHPADRQLLQTRLLTEADLYEDLQAQQSVMALIRQYGRQDLRKELERIHQSLRHDPVKKGWWSQILALFD